MKKTRQRRADAITDHIQRVRLPAVPHPSRSGPGSEDLEEVDHASGDRTVSKVASTPDRWSADVAVRIVERVDATPWDEGSAPVERHGLASHRGVMMMITRAGW